VLLFAEKGSCKKIFKNESIRNQQCDEKLYVLAVRNCNKSLHCIQFGFVLLQILQYMGLFCYKTKVNLGLFCYKYRKQIWLCFVRETLKIALIGGNEITAVSFYFNRCSSVRE